MPNLLIDTIKLKYLKKLGLFKYGEFDEITFLRVLTGSYISVVQKYFDSFLSECKNENNEKMNFFYMVLQTEYYTQLEITDRPYFFSSREELLFSLSNMLTKYAKEAVCRYALDRDYLKGNKDARITLESSEADINYAYNQFCWSKNFFQMFNKEILGFDWEFGPEIPNDDDLKEKIDSKSIEFFSQYPIIEKALSVTCENFCSYITEVCKNIWKDREIIKEIFFQEYEISALRSILSTGSDLHKNGRQTLILEFLTSNNNRVKLIYKPTDLSIDYLITGEYLGENDVSDNYPILKRKSLLTIFNERSKNVDRYRILPTYKILPASCIDVKPDQIPDGKVFEFNDKTKFIKAYGYIEFLSHEKNDYFISIDNNEDEAKTFYACIGQLIALSCIFGLTDVHFENLIVHNKLPYIIDLEVCLTQYVGFDVDLTGFIMSKKLDGEEASVLKGIDNKNRIKYWRYGAMRYYDPILYIPEISDGIKTIYNSMNSVVNLFEEIEFFRNNLRGVPVRVVPTNTVNFSSLIRSLYSCKKIYTLVQLTDFKNKKGCKDLNEALIMFIRKALKKQMNQKPKKTDQPIVIDFQKKLVHINNVYSTVLNKITFVSEDNLNPPTVKSQLDKFYRQSRIDKIKYCDGLFNGDDYKYHSLYPLWLLIFNDAYMDISILDFNIPVFYHLLGTCCLYDHDGSLVMLDLEDKGSFYRKDLLKKVFYKTREDKGLKLDYCLSVIFDDNQDEKIHYYPISPLDTYLRKTFNLIKKNSLELVNPIIKMIRENLTGSSEEK